MATTNIFDEGPLLDAVQQARLFKDSKTFVDMPLRKEPTEVLKAFLLLPASHSVQELRHFVEANFSEPGSDFCACKLDDWRESPDFISRLSSSQSVPDGWVGLVIEP